MQNIWKYGLPAVSLINQMTLKMTKSNTRILAEQIQAVTGITILQIHTSGMKMVQMGLTENLEQAYNYFLTIK